MVKFTLIENSLDSIKSGMDYLDYAEEHTSPAYYKRALLSLFQGAELILKEILVQIDPIIIFDKNSLFKNCESPLAPKIEELYECKSIDINGICQELKKYYPEQFKTGNLKVIKDLAKERNKIQHFAFESPPEALKASLIKLYLMVIKPAMILAGESAAEKTFVDGINRICFHEHMADVEEAFLNVDLRHGFSKGGCCHCNNYSLFIIYAGESYPYLCYCTSCGFEKSNIDISEFHECPECSANSAIYDEQLGAGMCLWHKCADCMESVLLEMVPCETCEGYLIEGSCENCIEEEKI